MSISLRLYTVCDECQRPLLIEREARDMERISCQCGASHVIKDLRKPFQSQLDEGPILKPREQSGRDKGYSNA